MLALVGRVCEHDPPLGKEDDFVRRSVGTGVVFGKGWIVLTALHVVEPAVAAGSPLYFYLYHSDAGVWLRRRMQAVSTASGWDVTLLYPADRSVVEVVSGRHSDYEPRVLDLMSADAGADVWNIGYPLSDPDRPSQPAVITAGTVSSRSGCESLLHIANYHSAPSSSSGAVVGRTVHGYWQLIGIHVKPAQQAASFFSSAAHFVSVMNLVTWYEKALPANCQRRCLSSLPITATRRQKKRKSTKHSAGAAAAAVDVGREEYENVVYEPLTGWVAYYNRRLAPVTCAAWRKRSEGRAKTKVDGEWDWNHTGGK